MPGIKYVKGKDIDETLSTVSHFKQLVDMIISQDCNLQPQGKINVNVRLVSCNAVMPMCKTS